MARIQAPKNRANEVAKELVAEFIKPSELAEQGPFNVIDAYTRKGQFGDECAFEVQMYVDGSSATITMKDTPARRKLVNFVKQKGSVGPFVLEQVGEERQGNQPWGFVPASDTQLESVGAKATS